jgi:molybdopterin-guanine dinucleotide biosynthesis protein A
MKAYLEEAQRQETPIDALKTELQALDPDLYAQLGLDFLNSPDELLNRLATHETELTAKKAELQAQADKAREKLIATQKEKAKEKDEIRKKVLDFLHQIGFDALLQSLTDQIIANINTNLSRY